MLLMPPPKKKKRKRKKDAINPSTQATCAQDSKTRPSLTLATFLCLELIGSTAISVSVFTSDVTHGSSESISSRQKSQSVLVCLQVYTAHVNCTCVHGVIKLHTDAQLQVIMCSIFSDERDVQRSMSSKDYLKSLFQQ